ncbi:CDP-alcohol phosphatidyltransferase family protein [Candidatus Rhabdochlamydia porcellionis]|jgi:CDP-diacylglycerol---serine O-phosphatidyltransferase|uniref:CDP-alcohol phosphatidyltransferase n=1 Tax=Candidatus Rhabdochlamydia porcellionis TaxID=225148 RepID=A0ABX8Z379_9BACT|nr:phosphatidylcholine/phosphatidylserine synthase [Candidatus Rhabdochlamydia porcellionis]QZA58537.1 CDP-alcohol phosphatidyltransferase [Candidatus Rhabdochlamydia porcellionis]
MRRVYLIPNMITAFGLACGLFVIFKVNMVEPGSGLFQVLRISVLLLLVAAFADLLDGAVARAFRAESEFGFIFDSLADAISFGVAPSVLLLKTLSLEPGTGLSFLAVLGAMLYSICGILRLVRFNVKTTEPKTNAEALSAKKHFTGLPIPAAALAAVSLNLLFASDFFHNYFPLSEEVHATTLSIVMIILGYFMVSRWKFPSSKALHFRVPSFQLVFGTVISAIFVFYGTLYFFPIMLTMVTWSYILLGWTLSIIRLIAGRKSKTLVDFEPEDED